MCSISGIFSLGQTSTDLRQAVERMNAAQKHRGPDDDGISRIAFDGGELFLGSTRLAVIDTSAAGHQPMNDPESRNWITYNGETYNFKDLRQQLSPQEWCSNTDTEVVLRAYRKWGVDAFCKLRGMFALALWDQQKQELLLARDPLGIKPLYYHVANHQLIFASELRALLAGGLAPRRLSAAGVDSFLATGSVESPLTIVDGIEQLLPGHYLRVRTGDSGALELSTHRFAEREIASKMKTATKQSRVSAVSLKSRCDFTS